MALIYSIGFGFGYIAGRYGPSVASWLIHGRPL